MNACPQRSLDDRPHCYPKKIMSTIPFSRLYTSAVYSSAETAAFKLLRACGYDSLFACRVVWGDPDQMRSW